MPFNTMFLILALLGTLGSFPTAVLGHAGHFHLYPDTPSGRNYVRQKMGTCNTWVTTAAAGTLTIEGQTDIWLYYYQNCTERVSSAFEMNVTVKDNGALFTNQTFDGYAQIDSCASPGPIPASYYLQSGTNYSNADLLIFFKNSRTDAVTGKIYGNAANSVIARTQGSDAWKSIVLYSADKGGAAVFCCEVDYTQTSTAALAALAATPGASACTVPPPPPPSGSASLARLPALAVLLSALLALFLA